MTNRILIIGDHKNKNADSRNWHENVSNLSDYDTVIVDVNALHKIFSLKSPGYRYSLNGSAKQIEILESIETNFRFVNKKLKECLLIDTQVFILFHPNTFIRKYENSSDVSLNSWFPISVKTQIEDGTTVVLQNKKYQQYLNRLKVWRYYFLPAEDSDEREVSEFYKPNQVKINKYEIATNKLGRPLAMELVPHYMKFNATKYEEQKSRIILLPVTSSEDTSEDIEEIIRLTKTADQNEAPEWVRSFVLPNEQRLNSERETAEITLVKAKSAYDNLVRHKRLLYDNSYSLQEMCEFTLKELGANIKPSIVSDEFIIEYKGKEALVEVKGKIKSIDKDDVGQLLTDMVQHMKETGKPIKGIFLGNAWRDLPPKDREANGRRVFPDNIIHIAESQNIGLVYTVDLYNAYCYWMNGKLSSEKFLDTIFRSSGVIRF